MTIGTSRRAIPKAIGRSISTSASRAATPRRASSRAAARAGWRSALRRSASRAAAAAATQPAINDPRFLNHLDFYRAVKTTLRAALHARRAGAWPCAATWPSLRRFKCGRYRARASSGLSRARAANARRSCRTRNIIGLNEHAATLHYQRLRAERARPSSARCLIDAGARIQRLRGRHHAHLLGVGNGRFRGADRVDGFAPAAHLRRSEARRRLRRAARLHAPPARRRAARAQIVTVQRRGGRRDAASRAASCRMGSGTCSACRSTMPAAASPTRPGSKREPPAQDPAPAADAHAATRRRRHDRARPLLHPVACSSALLGASTKRSSIAP